MDLRTDRQKAGYYSISDMARICGVLFHQLRYVADTRGPRPTHKYKKNKQRFYIEADIPKIKSQLEKYNKEKND